MTKVALALAAALALTIPAALAQKAEEPKKVALPANTFFKGQTSAQVLGKESLLGAPVLDKDGKTIAKVEDIILSGSQLEGLILSVGDKKVGVRIGALTLTTTEGKLKIVMQAGTPEVLAAVGAYQRAHTAKK
jgi:sporulation protein YlmC with PRC-barrel domain